MPQERNRGVLLKERDVEDLPKSGRTLQVGGTCVPSHWPQADREEGSISLHLSPDPVLSSPRSKSHCVLSDLMKGLSHPGARPFGNSTPPGTPMGSEQFPWEAVATPHPRYNSSPCFLFPWVKTPSGSGLLKGQQSIELCTMCVTALAPGH